MYKYNKICLGVCFEVKNYTNAEGIFQMVTLQQKKRPKLLVEIIIA